MQIPWGNEWTLLFLLIGILLVLFFLAPAVTRKPKKKKEFIVTIVGTIEKVLDDDLDVRGGRHQRLFVRIVKVLDNPGNAPIPRNENVFIAMRYGDRDGFSQRVQALDGAVGKKIEIRGKYIPHDPKTQSGPSSVIHFTHKPAGYIRFQNKTHR